MPKLTPIDYNPFEEKSSGVKLTPVDHDPFAPVSVDQPTSMPLSEVGKQFITNFPSSAYEGGKQMVSAITHPVQTVGAIGSAVSGLAAKLMPGEGVATPFEGTPPAADAMVNFFSQRYGGVENLKHTMATDPFGFLMDASVLLSGGGAIASKIPALGKAGEVLSAAGKAVEPINAVGKAVSPIAKGVGKLGTEVLGVSTGAGAESIKQAAKASPEFVKAMRGGTSGEEIVTTARNAVDAVKSMRSQDYVDRLAKLTSNTKELNISPIKDNLFDWLKKYNVKRVPVTKDNPRGLDFSRSALGKSANADIADVVDTIDSWGTKAGDRTPIMLDTLKRQLDDFYSDSSKARAMVADLKSTVRNTIAKEVPDYLTMTRNYEKTSNMINEVNRALSLKEGVSADTALRKLTTSMRENFEFRRDLIKYLEDASGQDIQAQVAGFQMKQLLPRGGLGKVLGAGELSFLTMIHPQLIPILLANSPRAVGEFFAVLKKPISAGKKVAETGVVGTPARQVAFQAGRVANNQPGGIKPTSLDTTDIRDAFSNILNPPRFVIPSKYK